jgi:alkaline phosphatase D
MRIVFTSCCDPVHDDRQRAWDSVRQLAPQHIVLLGDNIYMDYLFSQHLNARQVRKLGPEAFARKMHGSYARQWQVASFRAAVAGARVHAIWDDHDFAWNNSRGGGPDDGRDFVPADRRRISRALFQQFREALSDKPEHYPPYPLGAATGLPDLGGIHTHADLQAGVRLHLLDGRSFRQESGELLGAAQRQYFEGSWLPRPGLNLVASGVTLERDWSRFGDDLQWLRRQAQAHRLLVLSGDIHELQFSDEFGLPEATASAMAQPKFAGFGNKRTDAFGVLDVHAQRLVISLRQRDQEVLRREIDLVDWPY